MRCSIRFRSLLEAFKKIFWVNRILGIYPLDDECRIAPRYAILSAVILSVLTGQSVYWLFSVNRKIVLNSSLFHNVIYFFRKFLQVITSFICVLQIYVNRKKFSSIQTILKAIDDLLGSDYRPTDLFFQPIKNLLPVFFSFCTVFSQGLFYKEVVHWMGMHAHTIFLALFISQMCTLNDLLKECLRKIRSTRKYQQQIRMYNMVEQCSQDVNEIYGIGNLLCIIYFFIIVLYQLYTAIDKPKIYLNFINYAITGSCYLSLIMCIIISSNGVSFQMKKFNNELYKDLVEKGCEDMDLIYFHFENTREFEFTAHGFFPVNKRLVCSMILTGTTYLVVLVQYSPD